MRQSHDWPWYLTVPEHLVRIPDGAILATYLESEVYKPTADGECDIALPKAHRQR
jgi:hypothetical protein